MVDKIKPKINSKEVAKDLCMTPSYAVKPLIDLIGDEHSIWEPASGEGDLVRELDRLGVKVTGTTLEMGIDFFNETYCDDTSINSGIITNPPYSIKPEWVRRCYDLTNNWALLLPVEALAADGIQSQIKAHGGVSILMFDTRIDFKLTDGTWGDSSAQFPTCWVISGFGLEMNKIFYAEIKKEKAIFKKMHKMLVT